MTVRKLSSMMVLPARNMSCCSKEKNTKGPNRRQPQHDGNDGLPGYDLGEQPAHGADQRIHRHAHRVLEQERPLAHALGTSRDHVLLAQFVKQRPAEDANQPGRARGTDHDDRHRQVAQQIQHLGEAPRGVDVGDGEQPTDLEAEELEEHDHQHQRQQEVGGGKADEADHGNAVVGERVLVGRRVDPDGHRHQVDEHQGEQRNQRRHRQPFPQQFAHRAVVRERPTHVAAHHLAHPEEILDVERLVEAVLVAQILDFRLAHVGAAHLQLGDVVGDVVARR